MNNAFLSFRFTTSDGLSLHAKAYGPNDPCLPAVVCLPGLTRNARDFDGLAAHLSQNGFRVIAIDSRGRGLSDPARDAAEYNIVTEAEDVLAGLAALGVGRASFIGTSRGGLILHMLTGMRPAALKAVVLNDVADFVSGQAARSAQAFAEERQRRWHSPGERLRIAEDHPRQLIAE